MSDPLAHIVYYDPEPKTLITKKLLYQAPEQDEFYKEVYIALTKPGNREVAAVLIHKNTEKGKQIAHIELEALKHFQNKPGIIPTYAIVDTPNYQLFIQKLCKGGDLYSLLQKRPLTHKEKCTIFQQILQALQEIHTQGYLFVDTAPSNILLNEEVTKAYLTDFGAIRSQKTFRDPHLRYVLSKFAPELLKNRFSGLPFRETIKTDIWGMGNTFYLAHFGTFAPWYLSMQRREKREALDIMLDEKRFPEPKEKSSLDHLIWQMLRPQPQERISIEQALAYLSANDRDEELR